MKLKFSGRGLAFLAHFKATADIRYYLNGVYLAPMPAEAGGGVIGAATNGHILAMWHDKDGHIERPVIAQITPMLAKACGKTPDAVLVGLDGRLAAAIFYDGGDMEELFVQPNPAKKPAGNCPAWEVPGKYPVISRVIPAPAGEPAPRAAIGLNAHNLALISKAMPRSHRSFAGIALNQAHPEDGVLVTFPSIPEALVVVMPARLGADECAMPGWAERMKRSMDLRFAAQTAPAPAMPSDAEPPQ